MDRLACVDVPAFPLQLALQRHPAWRGSPVVVVAEDKPQAEIRWVNAEAQALRILPGQRFAHALSLAPGLRAAMISRVDLDAGLAQLLERLRKFSPHVEVDDAEPGVFWLDAGGLERLRGTVTRWSRELHSSLQAAGWGCAVVVGTSRFATYAIARHRAGVTVFDDAEAERAAARVVPLEALGVEPRLRDALGRLGITTVGAFVRLPAGGVLERFGGQAHRLHRLAAGEAWDPISPRPPTEPLEQRVYLDDPEVDVHRLVFAIKQGLDPLLGLLARHHRALAALHLVFTLDGAAPQHHLLRPAEPTLDARTLLRLLHLRLEASPPPAGVREIELAAEDVAASHEQLSLFSQRPRRDLRAAAEAFAQLRAELGNDAVLKAVLREGHLPESRFGWESLTSLPLPKPGVGSDNLIRRLYSKPRLLPPQPREVRNDGWLLTGLEHGPVDDVVGPYIICGGWWLGGVHREYHFVKTRRGECLWVYYDRPRRRWFLHGLVQ